MIISNPSSFVEVDSLWLQVLMHLVKSIESMIQSENRSTDIFHYGLMLLLNKWTISQQTGGILYEPNVCPHFFTFTFSIQLKYSCTLNERRNEHHSQDTGN